VAKVAVCLPLIGGFMALSVDMGYITAAHSDLVRAADSAALAAVLELNEHTSGGGLPCETGGAPIAELHARAVDRANRTLNANPVLGLPDLEIGGDSLELGYAELDPDVDGRYGFTPVGAGEAGRPNAVALTLGQDGEGSLSLIFAKVLGINAAQPTARAVAALSPRAVAMVFDNSTQMYHDSQLQHTVLSEAGENPDLQRVFQEVFGGRGWGMMDNFESEYYLPAGGNWLLSAGGGVFDRVFARALEVAGDPDLETPGRPFLFNEEFWHIVAGRVGGPFGPSVDLDATDDGRTVWHQRLAVMLGLAEWSDNGDAQLSSDEIAFTVPFPGQTGGEGWYDYFDFMMTTSDRDEAGYYVYDEDSPLSEEEQRERMLTPLEMVGDPSLGAHLLMQTFGVETFMNYLLFHQPSGPFGQRFVDTTVEPHSTGVTVVHDAAKIFACEFDAPEGGAGAGGVAGDALGLVTFDGGARANLAITGDFSEDGAYTDALQQAAYDRDPAVVDSADLAAGIDEAVEMLTASSATSPDLGIVREMVIVTVGWANIDADDSLEYLHVGHKAGAKDEGDPWLPVEMPGRCFEGPEGAIRNAHANGIAVSIVALGEVSNTAWFNHLEDEGIIAGWINMCRGLGAGCDYDRDALRDLLGQGRIPFLIQ